MLYSMEIICCKTVRHMPNARATSPDGYSECGYTKATSDTCTSFKENTESLYFARAANQQFDFGLAYVKGKY